MNRLLILLTVFSTIASAGFEQSALGPHLRALGGAGTALSGESYALFLNPSSIAVLRGLHAEAEYLPAQFGLKELALKSATISGALFGMKCALAGSRFGFELYSENSLGLALARDIPPLDVGVMLNYYSVSISSYGSSATFGIDVGVGVEIRDGLRWGCALRNINAPVIGPAREPLPQALTTGISYCPVHTIVIVADYRKEAAFDASLHFGLEYSPFQEISFRVGTSDYPDTYSCGIGLVIGTASISYSLNVHDELGLTNAIAVGVTWGGDAP